MVSAATHREQKVSNPCASPAKSRMAEKKIDGRGLKKVFICSPFRPFGESREERDQDWKRNIKTAKEACRYAVEKGCVPYAPHLYFPQFLSESDPAEREMGIIMGLSWLARCDEIWVAGFRVSDGMSREIAQAQEWGIPIKMYIPVPGAKNRVFDARFYTEEDFYRMLADEEEGRIYDEL